MLHYICTAIKKTVLWVQTCKRCEEWSRFCLQPERKTRTVCKSCQFACCVLPLASASAKGRNRKCQNSCVWPDGRCSFSPCRCTSLFICSSCKFRLQCELLHSYLLMEAPLAGLVTYFLSLWASQLTILSGMVFFFSLPRRSEFVTAQKETCFSYHKLSDWRGTESLLGNPLVWVAVEQWALAFCTLLSSVCICKSKHCRSLCLHPADPPTLIFSLAF